MLLAPQIWRLYVVWGHRWQVVVLPVRELDLSVYHMTNCQQLIVEAAHMGMSKCIATCSGAQVSRTTGSAFAATALFSKTDNNTSTPTFKHFGPVGWSLDLAVNISVTAAIAGRLLYMDRQTQGLGKRSRYTSSVFTIVESGAIFAAVTIAMLVLYVRGSVLALNGIDISTQLAVRTLPLPTRWSKNLHRY